MQLMQNNATNAFLNLIIYN